LYAVYFVPGTQVPMMYEFKVGAPDREPDRVLSQSQANRLGAIKWGITSELAARGQNHWDIFLSDLDRQAQTQPWLKDPGALANVVDAWLRDADPVVGASQWEQSLNADQRAWLRMVGADPQTARVRQEQAREKVRNEALNWLGPYYGNMSDAEIDRWAQTLASNESQGQVQLNEYLRQARLAAFPEWTDPNMGYEQIARIGRQLFTQVWGESPDETDPLFLRVISGRDHVASMELLRKEGWDRGVGQVTQDAIGGLLAATGGQVRRPM
jgi:hypothetical protein